MKNCGCKTTVKIILCLAVCGTVNSLQSQVSQKPVYLDPTQPAEARAADLVGRMTLEEKATQMVNQARAIERLKIPAYDWWSESLHGVAVDGTTEFPEPIGLAATFDVPAIHAMAAVIGTEGRIKHAQDISAGHSRIFEGLDFWAPNINIFRDPRWGRGQETYGEDPFLTARMGVAFVRGMQGDDPKYYRVISTPKHFAVHSGPETTRHKADVKVSKHDELDTYLPAFRATVTEAKAGSVMCAYNSINGEPACANEFLLGDQLRGKWKFNGYVVSDCGAVIDIYEGHKFKVTQVEATAASVKSGMDNECVDYLDVVKDDHDYKPYLDAVKAGYLKESDLDRALVRQFTARMKLGMFDPPEMVPYSKIDESLLDSQLHRAMARKIADESMVLLKNDGVLPLRKGARIAVIGPLANQTAVLLGNYNGKPSHTVSILEGLRSEFGEPAIQYAEGTRFLYKEKPDSKAETKTDAVSDALMLKKALDAAQSSDVVVAVVGITSELEGEEMKVDVEGFNGGDRTSIALPKPEEELLAKLAATGKPLVIVLTNGSALGLEWERAHANAILDAWYPGEEGGTAVAETLSGKNNPAGRLPVTFYKDVSQLPPFEDYSMKGRTYRYFAGEPVYAFGFGLSYSKFSYSGFSAPAKVEAGKDFTAAVTVKNEGEFEGDEVVQLYLSFPPLAGAPIRALRGFERVHLKAGESKQVRFTLNPRDLSLVTDVGVPMVAEGLYGITIGGGQPGTGAPVVSGNFNIQGSLTLPE
jgi:beta-glucosidase